jgi:hypothetical protein
MSELKNFKVVLKPFTVEKQVGNITVTQSLNQDQVIIVTAQGQQMWGYSPTLPGHGTFLPLSGFPKELCPEVQRQINEIRGTNDKPPVMIESGRTAAEQAAESVEDDESEEEYE